MRILIACEESQTVCKAMRLRGHECYSADIQEPSGGHPEWHILGNVLDVINPLYSTCGISFTTMNGDYHQFSGKWDLIIAHPPCTYLTVTGNRWFDVSKYGDKALKRIKEREAAIDFFLEIANANCDKICIENPVGVISTRWRKPDQIIQPFMFGDPFEKKTCLWLKGLPKLEPTNIVNPPNRIKFKSGKTMPAWYADAFRLPAAERARLRSKTFEGIAEAMAEQWAGQATEI